MSNADTTDPFGFFKQWYEASHDAWSKSIEEIIGNDKFVEAASRYMESYTTFYKNFYQLNEEAFSHLPFPTRSDITRIAELIVTLEKKVDTFDDRLDELPSTLHKLDALQDVDARLQTIEAQLHALPATFASNEPPDIQLTQRLDRVEQKLDTLITLLTQTNAHEPTEASIHKIASNSNTKTRKAPKTPKKVSEETPPSTET